MTDIPPITPLEHPERRQSERRADWHTPETCFKLLDVQTTMDRIFDRFKEGDARMDSIVEGLEDSKITIGCMQDNIAGNHRVVCDDIRELKAALYDNSAQTREIFEIIEMGKGVFKFFFVAGKWARKIVMWVVPPVAAIIGLWQALTSKHP